MSYNHLLEEEKDQIEARNTKNRCEKDLVFRKATDKTLAGINCKVARKFLRAMKYQDAW